MVVGGGEFSLRGSGFLLVVVGSGRYFWVVVHDGGWW